MKISTAQNPVTMSAAFVPKAFSITDMSKIFKIMIDLYSDRPLAVVRELVCNAADASIDAFMPFLVSSPTPLDPSFSVRDYGAGMSPEFMQEGYTQVGFSTKSDDNDAVGGFGLGRLSAMTYTDQYTVTTYTGGLKRVYSVFRGDGNVPQVILLTTEESHERPGTEVKVPVKATDFPTFKDRCEKVLQWFPRSIFKAFGFVPKSNASLIETPLWKVVAVDPNGPKTYRSGGYVSTAHTAQLGPITYPLKWSMVPGLELPASIVPIFAVGELELPPSREGISYDPRTIAALAARRAVIVNEVVGHFRDRIKTMTTVEKFDLVKDMKAQGLEEMFKAHQVKAGTWVAGTYKANPGWGAFFRYDDEHLVMRGDFRLYEKSNRSQRISSGYANRSEFEFETSQSLLGTRFIFHDMTGQTAPRTADRLAEVEFGTRLLLVQPCNRFPTLAKFRAQAPDLPGDLFQNLSDIYIEPKMKAVKGPVTMNVYHYEPGSTSECNQVSLIEKGVYVEYTASEMEPGVGRLLTMGLHEVRVYGLTKKARSMVDMSKFIHLRDYIEAKAQAFLADPAWVSAYSANRVMTSLSVDDRHLVRAMATRPKAGALFSNLAKACRALLDDDVTDNRLQSVMRELDRAPPVVDTHNIEALIKAFHDDHPLLSFVLGVSNRSETLRFDGSHDHHLKEMV